jgi:hypothetical protein
MTIFTEEHGKLKIKQCQAEGWADGIYNTYISYNGTTIAINHHFHATEHERRPISIAVSLYNLTNELEIVPQCNIFNEILNDIYYLRVKIKGKTELGAAYSFDLNFVNNVLKDTVNTINDNVKNIYANLKFEALANGRMFFPPLPDYTSHNLENIPKNESSKDIAIEVKNDKIDETLELAKQTKKKLT